MNKIIQEIKKVTKLEDIIEHEVIVSTKKDIERRFGFKQSNDENKVCALFIRYKKDNLWDAKIIGMEIAGLDLIQNADLYIERKLKQYKR